MLDQQIRIAGRGVAELPIPLWLKAARIWILLNAFLLVLSAAFLLDGWRWVTDAGADGLSTGFALWCAAVVTAAAAAPLLLLRTRALDAFLNIRKPQSPASDARAVFGGFRTAFGPLVVLLGVVLPAGANTLLITRSIATCPLPEVLVKLRLESPAPRPDAGLMPIYFWDYATWLDSAWLDQVNLVLPYEKGPPQKLLPKIFFEDAVTHLIVLELHGKRPRSYDQGAVYDIFNSTVVQPRDWPLLWRLEREAGLTADGLSAPTLYLLRLAQPGSSDVTQAIGVPWDRSNRPESGRVFFWGPDGSVFQVKCPSPCRLARLLELVRFPRDPKGSRLQRLEWTKTRLKELLARLEAAKPAGAADEAAARERRRDENLLSLYLVSLLTLDPRDPEAFFHLGKLARNLTTVRSAIGYGRDLGLEHVKLLELEGVADRLSP